MLLQVSQNRLFLLQLSFLFRETQKLTAKPVLHKTGVFIVAKPHSYSNGRPKKRSYDKNNPRISQQNEHVL
jgi:hypothetical protein